MKKEKRKKRNKNEEEREEEQRIIKQRYVCSCNIENMSHFLLIIQMEGGVEDGGWGRRQLRMKTST